MRGTGEGRGGGVMEDRGKESEGERELSGRKKGRNSLCVS